MIKSIFAFAVAVIFMFGTPLYAQGAPSGTETSTETNTETQEVPSGTSNEIVLYEWFNGGKLIATGVKFKINLAAGTQIVAFETTNSDGVTDATSVVVTIQPPDEMDVDNAGPDVLIRYLAGKSINVTLTDDGYVIVVAKKPE